MKNLLISGYRSYELQIFSDEDIKLKFLKSYLKDEIKRLIEEGWQWFIITGQLGVEQWAAEVVLELKPDYPEIKLAILFPYEGFGNQWNEENQLKLKNISNEADYVNYTSQEPYFTPKQLQANQEFILRNVDGVLLVYDDEYPGKSKYLKQALEQFKPENNFSIFQTTMSDLELFVTDHADLFSDREEKNRDN